jgi:hypothetical protein
MKIYVNMHSAATAYGLVKGDKNVSKFLVIPTWGRGCSTASILCWLSYVNIR